MKTCEKCKEPIKRHGEYKIVRGLEMTRNVFSCKCGYNNESTEWELWVKKRLKP